VHQLVDLGWTIWVQIAPVFFAAVGLFFIGLIALAVLYAICRLLAVIFSIVDKIDERIAIKKMRRKLYGEPWL